jgi:hypothetical protein
VPIVRTYACPDCFARTEVVLDASEWDRPAPSCEACDARLNQEFSPPAIGGSVRSRAVSLAENIIANDYGVANFKSDGRQGGTPTVRYKDQTASTLPSEWQRAGHQAILEQAIAIGKMTKRESRGLGDGLDILKRGLATGVQPDLIEASKKRAIKVW